MPKATITYQLPEEQEEYTLAMKGGDYSAAVWELDQQFFRANIKYGVSNELLNKIVESLNDKSLTSEQIRDVVESTLQICRSKLWEELSSHGITDL